MERGFMLARVVSNALFWLGVVSVVGQFIVVTYASIRLRDEVKVSFEPVNVAAAALVFLAAATARYLGY